MFVYFTRKRILETEYVSSRSFIFVFHKNRKEEVFEVLEVSSYMESRYAPNPITTVKSVVSHIVSFLNFLESRKLSLYEVDTKEMMSYINFLKKEGVKSFRRKINVCIDFLNFCVKMSKIATSELFDKEFKWNEIQPIQSKRNDRIYELSLDFRKLTKSEEKRGRRTNEVNFLKDEEIKKIRSFSKEDPMIDALILLMSTTGIRISEALSLKVSDIPKDFESQDIVTFKYKRKGQGSTYDDRGLNNYFEKIFIPTSLIKKLIEITANYRKEARKSFLESVKKHEKWGKKKRKKFSEYFFITKNGTTLKVDEAYKRFSEISAKSQINFRSHDFRRYAINDRAQISGIYSARVLAKHASSEVTKNHYIEQKTSQIEAILRIQKKLE